ncbi:ITSN2 [Branchiostoma lanceolatum]|uniref:ITSN2 protein n=1 Tax=Branchiostoma lanceolatum TaxID=7740 RepID=A0A8J9Z7J2_BRALA|nr:ITSN2 [Branchiostoma lanceolatum]
MSEMSLSSQTSQKTFVDSSQLNQIHKSRTDDCGLESFHINAESRREATGAVPSANEVHCPPTKESSSVQELGQAPPATTEQKDSCFEKVELDTVRTNCNSSDDNSPHKVGGMSLFTVEWTLRRNKGCLVEAVNSNEDSATPYVSAKDQLKSLTSSESPSGKVSPRSWYSRHWSAPITPKPMLETNLAVTTSVASNDSSPASTPRVKRKQIFDVCTAVSEKLQRTEATKAPTEGVQERTFASDRQDHQHTADHNGNTQEECHPNLSQEKVGTRTTCEGSTQPERCLRTDDCGSPSLKSENEVERKHDTIFQTVDTENKSLMKTGNSTVSHTGSNPKETGVTVEVCSDRDNVENSLGTEKLSMWGSFTDDNGGIGDSSRRGSGQSSQSSSSGDDTQVSMPEIQLVFQDSPVHQQKESSEETNQDAVFDLTALIEQEQEEGMKIHDNDQEEVFHEDSKRVSLSNECDNTEERKQQGMFLHKSWTTEETDFDKICNHDERAAKDKNREKQSTSKGRSDSYRKRGLERQKPVSSTSEELFARKYKSERKSSTDGNMPAEKGKTPKRSVTWHALVRTSEVKTESKQKPPSVVARSTSDVTNSSSKDSRQDKTPRPVKQHHSDPSSMALHRTRNWLHRHHGMEDLTIVEGVPSDQSDKRASRTKSKNRHSNVSTASVDSGVIALGEERAIMERRPSAVDIARNDSGVGMETIRVPRKTRETTDESNCADCEKVNTVIDVEEEDESPRSYRTEDTALCLRCEKRRVERKEAIQELVQTELSYGADLRVIKEEFYEPIEKAGLLTPQQLQTIFINILELLEVNDRFADKLQDAIEHAQEQGDEDYISVNIGRIFLQAANMLMAFETYCTKQPAAPAMLKTLESEKDLFRIFLEVSQTDNSALRRMHLSSFLMAPLQRITKYPLLLSRLYKSTSCHHPDRDRLLEAQQLVEEHLEHINIKTQGSGGLMRLKKKSSRTKSTSSVENIELREMALDAVSWNKDEVHFIQMGKLQVVQCGDTWARKTKVCSVHALLLVLGQMPNLQALEEKRQPSRDKPVKGGALVLIRDKGAGRFTTLRDPFFLDKCVVSTDPDSEETFEISEIYKDPYILKGEDPSDTSRWLSLLQGLSRDLGNWRKRRNALANIMIHMVSRT